MNLVSEWITSGNLYQQLMLLVKQVSGMGDAPGYFDLGNVARMFLWYMVYKTIKMRAIGTLSKKHLILMGGSLIAVLGKGILFAVELLYKNDGIQEIIVKNMYAPLNHTLEFIAYLCVCYYSLKTIKFWPNWLDKTKKLTVALPVIILIGSYYNWISDIRTNQYLQNFNNSPFDLVFHGLSSAYLLSVLIAFNVKFSKPFRGGLYTYLFLNFVISTAHMTSFSEPCNSEFSQILDFAQMMSLPFLLYHLIKSYTWKLNEVHPEEY